MARLLSNWLASYAEYTDISEAPATFDFWTGVVTIAGALRKQVCIDEGRYKFYPNFYVIFVAPPGIATKSTTMQVGMKLLRQIEGITMGPTTMTWQGLTKKMMAAKIAIPLSDPLTTDPLALEYFIQSPITCAVSELGTFLDMRNGELISVLIDLWDGADIPWERWLATKDDTFIENPHINIIGATTPSWLNANFDELTIGGGLTSRIIFAYAQTKRRLIPFASDFMETLQQKALEKELVSDLREISTLRGVFTISREAKFLVSEWYERHWGDDREAHLRDPRFAGYCARKQAHLLKLSMILSVSRSDNLEIISDDVRMALGLLKITEDDMIHVFKTIGKVMSSRNMDIITAHLRIKRKVLKLGLWRSCMNSMSAKDFGEALNGLIQAGIARVVNELGEYYVFYIPQESDIKAEKEAEEEEEEDESEDKKKSSISSNLRYLNAAANADNLKKKKDYN